jgi:hypothetical protein
MKYMTKAKRTCGEPIIITIVRSSKNNQDCLDIRQWASEEGHGHKQQSSNQ